MAYGVLEKVLLALMAVLFLFLLWNVYATVDLIIMDNQVRLILSYDKKITNYTTDGADEYCQSLGLGGGKWVGGVLMCYHAATGVK